MRRLLVAASLALAVPLTASAEEAYRPGLGEIMSLQQMRHLKLWYAGEAGNWELADYELEELKEGFEDIAKYFPNRENVPTGPMSEAIIEKEVADLNKAIEAKDGRRFATAFDRLTAACNACHQAAKKAFIVVQRPAANPYANQSFAPPKK